MRSIKEMDKRLDEREQEIERLQKELDKTRLSELDKEYRIDKAINRISLIRMDRDTSIETHKALDEILNVLRGSDKE